jgi:hypothetical protein
MSTSDVVSPSVRQSPRKNNSNPFSAACAAKAAKAADDVLKGPINKYFKHTDVDETFEDHLAAMLKKSTTSACYGHFQTPVLTAEKIKNKWVVQHKYVCKAERSKCVALRNWNQAATTSLLKQKEKCEAASASAGESPFAITKANTKRTPLSVAKVRALLIEWVATCNRPFSIVEDKPLGELCVYMHPDVDLPAANTLSSNLQQCFPRAAEIVKQYFEVS